MKLGFQPVNLSAQFYYNVEHPTGASSWNAKFQVTRIFSKLSPAMEKMMLKQKLKSWMKQNSSQQRSRCDIANHKNMLLRMCAGFRRAACLSW